MSKTSDKAFMVDFESGIADGPRLKVSINAPSYRRPAGVDTLRYLPGCRIWVCETEAEAYRAENTGAEIVHVPVGVQGNVSRIRNWILDREYDRGVDAVCIIDDDLKYIGVHEQNLQVKLPGEVVPSWVEYYTEIAHQWGVKLWGVNCNRDKQSYAEFAPFSTLRFIGSPFSVHIRSDIRYDERLPLKEDYDLTLQHLNKHRGVLRVNKYFYQVRQGGSGTGQTGGCAVYRNIENELAQLELLVKKWGHALVKRDNHDRNHMRKKNKGVDINPVIRVPISGI